MTRVRPFMSAILAIALTLGLSGCWPGCVGGRPAPAAKAEPVASPGSYTLSVGVTSVHEGKTAKTSPQSFVGFVSGTETQLSFLLGQEAYFYLVEESDGKIALVYPPTDAMNTPVAGGTPLLCPEEKPVALTEGSSPGDVKYTAILSPEKVASLDVLINGGQPEAKVEKAVNELKKLHIGTSSSVAEALTQYTTTDKVLIAEFTLTYK